MNKENTFSRPLTIEDILETSDNPKNNKRSENDIKIQKNQEHYGHRKRIKP